MRSRFAFVLGLCVLTLAGCSWFGTPENGAENVPVVGETASSAPDEDMDSGVTMKGGAMLVVTDGEMSRMEEDVAYEDGTSVKVDGTVTLADGTVLMLPEGMMVTVDGRLRMLNAFDGAAASAVIMAPSFQDSGDTTASSAPSAAATSATYTVYTDAVLKDGKTKVLFFAAGWCPECKEHDAALKTWFPSGEFTRSVYKVDYDTAKDLKAKYNVVYQHTFVVVDGQGNKVSSIQRPTDEQLKALLK